MGGLLVGKSNGSNAIAVNTLVAGEAIAGSSGGVVAVLAATSVVAPFGLVDCFGAPAAEESIYEAIVLCSLERALLTTRATKGARGAIIVPMKNHQRSGTSLSLPKG